MSRKLSPFGIVKAQDIELPERIYKYRSWARDDHRRILTHNEIHFSHPLDLSSNTELVFKRSDEGISDKDLFDYYYTRIKEENTIAEEEHIVAEARKWANNSPLRDPVHVKKRNEIFQRRLNNWFGIFSVSKHNNIERMWEDFGDNHYGICVGLDSKQLLANDLPLSAGGHVDYYKEEDIPVYKPFYYNLTESVADMLNILFSLPIALTHEDEYRLIRSLMLKKQVSVTDDCFKEVILGRLMKEKEKEEIRKLVSEKFKGCQISEAS